MRFHEGCGDCGEDKACGDEALPPGSPEALRKVPPLVPPKAPLKAPPPGEPFCGLAERLEGLAEGLALGLAEGRGRFFSRSLHTESLRCNASVAATLPPRAPAFEAAVGGGGGGAVTSSDSAAVAAALVVALSLPASVMPPPKVRF